ncbi:hypothetical protein [Picosynechococcus sp. PCC 11901]|uniref:hypothetical protein n=1 Tax=Picosynechococcus sp. PCC 11901 TaxID=2579791 RepID=UPI00143D49CC|nr:hypothetical protein [Picosynechococcus sp. PCC 11901]
MYSSKQHEVLAKRNLRDAMLTLGSEALLHSTEKLWLLMAVVNWALPTGLI